jgi:hypothetical protein
VAPSVSAPVAPPLADVAGQADLDGDGRVEAFSLSPEGLLRVGSAQTTITFRSEMSPDTGWGSLPTLLRVVDLDSRDGLHELLVTHRASGSEDPPWIFELFRYQAGTLLRLGELQTGPGLDLVFPGNGSVRRNEAPWEVCTRASSSGGDVRPGRKVARHEIEYRLDQWGAKLVESSKRKLDTVACDELAACPEVYVVGSDGREVFAGEILRELRGRENAALQPLRLPVATEGVLHVRLREAKPETTYISEVWLAVDGRRVAPREGNGSRRLEQGDTLDLRFELGPENAREVVLWARGYYVSDAVAPAR